MDTNFVDKQTVIQADWLNDVNDFVYSGTLPGTNHKSVTSVDLITAVNATTLADGSTIVAKGRLSVGDNAGGVFTYNATSTATIDNGLVFAPATGPGRLIRDISDSTHIKLSWFAPMDGSVQTTAFSAWISAIQTTKKRGWIDAGTLVFETPVVTSSSFPGIDGVSIFHSKLYYNGTAGTTGLTLSLVTGGGQYGGWSITSGLPGDSVATARTVTRNGILWQGGGGQAQIGTVKAYNFNGFGQKFIEVWDSFAAQIIAESCGNDSQYAIDVTYSGDTSNHTIFARVHAELSYSKAFQSAPNNLNITFQQIHAERTTGNGTDYTHVLQGGGCTFENARIQATSNVKVLFGGANTYQDINCSGEYVAYSYGSSVSATISKLQCATLDVLASNVSNVKLDDCDITSLRLFSQAKKVTTVDCRITNVTLDGNTTDAKFVRGAISGSWTIVGTPTSRIDNVILANIPGNQFVFIYDSEIASGYTTGFNQVVKAYRSTFLGNITLANNGGRFEAQGCSFSGNLGYTSGQAHGKLDALCIVTGTVDGRWYGVPVDQAWVQGDRRYNPKPAAGTSVCQVCVTSGTPGTWKAEAALAA